jgi:hypothetical protein
VSTAKQNPRTTGRRTLGGRHRSQAHLDVLGYARCGHVIVVHTLDRLGRTVPDTLNMIHELAERGVGVRNLADPHQGRRAWRGRSPSQAGRFLLNSLHGIWSMPKPATTWSESVNPTARVTAARQVEGRHTSNAAIPTGMEQVPRDQETLSWAPMGPPG